MNCTVQNTENTIYTFYGPIFDGPSWRCELLDIFEGGMEELIYGFPLNVMELMYK